MGGDANRQQAVGTRLKSRPGAAILSAMRPLRHLGLRALLFLTVARGATGLGVTAYGAGFLDDFEQQSVDARFSVRGDRPPSRDIVFVKVDDVTFSDLNVRWPFPRTLHARLLDRIRAGHPRMIAFDVQFSEYGTAREDNPLGMAIQRNSGKVALATTEVTRNGVPNLIFGEEGLRHIGARAGSATLEPDKGGTIRRFPYETEGLESFALVTAEIALGHHITRGNMGGGSQWIELRALSRTRSW